MPRNILENWMGATRHSEYGFFNAVVFCLEQFHEKNNAPLTALVAICNGKQFKNYKIVEGDRLKFASPLKRILSQALSNATLTFKDGKAKWKVGNNGGVNRDVLETLRMLSAQKMSIRSDAFKDAFPIIRKEAPEKSLDELKRDAYAAVLRRLAKDGLTFADLVEVNANTGNISDGIQTIEV